MITFYRVTLTITMERCAWIEAISEADALTRAQAIYRSGAPHVWSEPTIAQGHIVTSGAFRISTSEDL